MKPVKITPAIGETQNKQDCATTHPKYEPKGSK